MVCGTHGSGLAQDIRDEHLFLALYCPGVERNDAFANLAARLMLHLRLLGVQSGAGAFTDPL